MMILAAITGVILGVLIFLAVRWKGRKNARTAWDIDEVASQSEDPVVDIEVPWETRQ